MGCFFLDIPTDTYTREEPSLNYIHMEVILYIYHIKIKILIYYNMNELEQIIKITKKNSLS